MNQKNTECLLGVDTGGTFTDFVFFNGQEFRTHKVLSTPKAPEHAILQGIDDLGLRGKSFYLVHGSTVATNAVLERKGVRTAYIGNYGLGDLLTIGRQARRELYDLQPPMVDPPVPRELCIETGGRIGADGSVIEALSEHQCQQVIDALERLKPEAVAINLLFSFLDDRFEQQLYKRLSGRYFVSASSDVFPQAKEYERGIATWLNAWVGPIMERYLTRLANEIKPSPVHVMQSSALTVRADLAAGKAVNLLLSGPAGGLIGALQSAKLSGINELLTFDMGGTSTDVALLKSDVSLTTEGHIGPYPVAVPMVDMHTIGAGGGSIARLDEGGMLLVGPESAGADPGPACYGRGGVEATVTDANLLLGRLRPTGFLGGKMPLELAAARQAVGNLAADMGVDIETAALGIIHLANEHMAQALRVISVQRGIDPGAFTLSAFGGAGGLHVCELAAMLNMKRAMIPAQAGVLSALGMLVAPRGRRLTHALGGVLAEQDATELEALYRRLVDAGTVELQEEGVLSVDIEEVLSVDLRYQGQSNTLELDFQHLAQLEGHFHAAHQQRYGYQLDNPIELVNINVSLRAPAPQIDKKFIADRKNATPLEMAALVGEKAPVPVWRLSTLQFDECYCGPMLIVDDTATVFVDSDWMARLDKNGNLLLERF